MFLVGWLYEGEYGAPTGSGVGNLSFVMIIVSSKDSHQSYIWSYSNGIGYAIGF